MHDAFGGAPRGSRNGRFWTGAFTAEMIAATRHVRGAIADSRRASASAN
jgi:hypothetical protein